MVRRLRALLHWFLRRFPTALGRAGILALTTILTATIVWAAGFYLPGAVHPHGSPVRAAIETNEDKVTVNGSPVGGVYLLAGKAIADVPPPPDEGNSCVGRYDWAHNQGGVDVGSRLALVLQGKTSKSVAVISVTPKVVTAATPPFGSEITCGGQGGNISARRISVSLSKATASYQYFAPTGDANKSFGFTLPGGQSEELYVDSTAVDCLCSWVLDFTVSIDGRQRHVQIPPNGSPPFVTSADVNAKQYVRLAGKWVFHAPEGAGEPDLSGMMQLGSQIVTPPLTASQLVRQDDVDAVYNTHVGGPNGATGFQISAGLAIPASKNSLCFYTYGSPQADGLVPTVGVTYTAAFSVSDAQKEMLKEADMMMPNGDQTKIVGIGDEAVLGRDAILVRNGSRILTLNEAPATGDSMSRLRALAMRVVGRM